MTLELLAELLYSLQFRGDPFVAFHDPNIKAFPEFYNKHITALLAASRLLDRLDQLGYAIERKN